MGLLSRGSNSSGGSLSRGASGSGSGEIHKDVLTITQALEEQTGEIAQQLTAEIQKTGAKFKSAVLLRSAQITSLADKSDEIIGPVDGVENWDEGWEEKNKEFSAKLRRGARVFKDRGEAVSEFYDSIPAIGEMDALRVAGPVRYTAALTTKVMLAFSEAAFAAGEISKVHVNIKTANHLGKLPGTVEQLYNELEAAGVEASLRAPAIWAGLNAAGKQFGAAQSATAELMSAAGIAMPSPQEQRAFNKLPVGQFNPARDLEAEVLD